MSEKTILVVDDVGYTRLLFDRMLSQDGYTILQANCGRDALTALNHRMVHLILLDLNLPDMTGIELLTRVRHTHRKIPVIMITASDKAKWMESADELGVFDIFFKPVDINVLRATVNDYLTAEPAILVVEDEEHSAFLMEQQLEHAGYKIISARNGILAKKMIEFRPICLITLDLNLPGIDGMELCRFMDNSDINIPIIICSAFISKESASQITYKNVKGYLTKPIDRASLIQKVALAIGTYRSTFVEEFQVFVLGGAIINRSLLETQIAKNITIDALPGLVINIRRVTEISSPNRERIHKLLSNDKIPTRLVIHPSQQGKLFYNEEARGLVFQTDLEAIESIKNTGSITADTNLLANQEDSVLADLDSLVNEPEPMTPAIAEPEHGDDQDVTIGWENARDQWEVRTVRPDELQVGMILDQPVTDSRKRNILIGKNVNITPRMIARILEINPDLVVIKERITPQEETTEP